jgi:hypothetical protein
LDGRGLLVGQTPGADGIGDAILVRAESGAGLSLRLAYNILQAAGCRSS